jgi:uncharacterized protein
MHRHPAADTGNPDPPEVHLQAAQIAFPRSIIRPPVAAAISIACERASAPDKRTIASAPRS